MVRPADFRHTGQWKCPAAMGNLEVKWWHYNSVMAVKHVSFHIDCSSWWIDKATGLRTWCLGVFWGSAAFTYHHNPTNWRAGIQQESAWALLQSRQHAGCYCVMCKVSLMVTNPQRTIIYSLIICGSWPFKAASVNICSFTKDQTTMCNMNWVALSNRLT